MNYHVSFPKLGINLTINPVAFSFKNFSIRWYGVIIAVGFTLAFFYILSRCKSFNLKKNDVENLTIFSFFSAIIFARLYYVVFYPSDYYFKNPEKIFLINEGGIAIYGAIIGGIVAIFIYCKIKKKNFFSTLDIMSLAVLIGQFIGRWGNFTNQEAFGSQTSLPWAMMSENTANNLVHPCFLYESLGCFLCFLFLHFYSIFKKPKNGKIFFMYTALYGILRAVVETFRTDSLMFPNSNFKISQILALVLSISSFAVLKFKYKTSQN